MTERDEYLHRSPEGVERLGHPAEGSQTESSLIEQPTAVGRGERWLKMSPGLREEARHRAQIGAEGTQPLGAVESARFQGVENAIPVNGVASLRITASSTAVGDRLVQRFESGVTRGPVGNPVAKMLVKPPVALTPRLGLLGPNLPCEVIPHQRMGFDRVSAKFGRGRKDRWLRQRDVLRFSVSLHRQLGGRPVVAPNHRGHERRACQELKLFQIAHSRLPVRTSQLGERVCQSGEGGCLS